MVICGYCVFCLWKKTALFEALGHVESCARGSLTDPWRRMGNVVETCETKEPHVLKRPTSNIHHTVLDPEIKKN